MVSRVYCFYTLATFGESWYSAHMAPVSAQSRLGMTSIQKSAGSTAVGNGEAEAEAIVSDEAHYVHDVAMYGFVVWVCASYQRSHSRTVEVFKLLASVQRGSAISLKMTLCTSISIAPVASSMTFMRLSTCGFVSFCFLTASDIAQTVVLRSV